MTIFGGLMYQDINDATFNLTVSSTATFDVTRCGYGKYLVANGTCVNCA